MSIHQHNYARYDGELKQGGAAWVIARTSLGVFWGMTRTKLVLLFLMLMPLATLLLVYLEYQAMASSLADMLEGLGEPSPMPLRVFNQLQYFSLALLYTASGCGVVSDDIRYRAIQLYFSKPLTRADYALGKYGALFGLGALITVLPAAVIAVFRAALYTRLPYTWEVIGQMGAGLVLTTAMTAIMALVVMGLSSVIPRTRYVVLAFIGVIIVPEIAGLIAGAINESEDIANLFSVRGALWLITRVVLSDEALDIPLIAPVFALTLFAVLGLGAVSWRVTKLEGIA
ncbi:MAG: hypothetical protein AAGI01_03270 [Myxococcota bacterium]